MGKKKLLLATGRRTLANVHTIHTLTSAQVTVYTAATAFCIRATRKHGGKKSQKMVAGYKRQAQKCLVITGNHWQLLKAAVDLFATEILELLAAVTCPPSLVHG